MAALGRVAEFKPKPVYAKLDTVLAAYENGSVITRDHAVSVLAGLYKADAAYGKRVMSV